jgi:predicted heme/steroid binding protein
MKFKLLLFILSQKLKKAAKSNLAFKAFIKGKDVKVIMKTADGRQGRAYIVRNGKIDSSTRDFSNADAAFVWSDGNTAFKVMSAGDDEAIIAAMTDKTLQAEGNFKEFIWFLTALGKMSVQQA